PRSCSRLSAAGLAGRGPGVVLLLGFGAMMTLPNGWHSLTPRIVVEDVDGLVEFTRRAFGATGEVRADRPVVMAIGDSFLMISGVGPRPAVPAFLYVYVQDADETYRRALQAGARSLEEPSDMPYGDRRAMVEDGWGNVWQIATPGPEVTVEATGSSPAGAEAIVLAPIGRVRSALVD